MNTFVEVLLVLTIITGEGKPNATYREQMPSMEACFEEAKRFVEHRFPDTIGAQGIGITCMGKFAKEEKL